MQVALEHVEPAEDGMHVRVLEAGKQHAPEHVDHLGPGSTTLAHLVIGANGEDATSSDRQRLSP